MKERFSQFSLQMNIALSILLFLYITIIMVQQQNMKYKVEIKDDVNLLKQSMRKQEMITDKPMDWPK